MKLAVFMDPVEHIKAYKDSSVAMLQSAQKSGFDCYFFTETDLFCQDGKAFANISHIKIGDVDARDWAEIEVIGDRPLTDFDIILIRKDPPFSTEYIYAMHALKLAENAGVLVANKPNTLCAIGEKTYTLHFPELCPETLVTKDCQRLREFWKLHKSVIFKPLDAMGGQGIFHVTDDSSNLSVILDLLTNRQQITIMAQKYIPEIKTHGDKRILLIGGKPVPYALARMPALGEFRGNLNAGATGEVVPITTRDMEICEHIAPSLNARGLYFVGIDVIGDFLTEINVTSPTCIREIEAETDLDIAGDYINFLKDKVQT
jgi:glutathione synthase